jgi:UDP-N-acetylmuramoyl-L-alanyl-D-glutamate--2,6-diaminopimelate ligase
MILAKLIKDLKYKKFSGDKNLEINKIEYDSRLIQNGDLFVAISGFQIDGHNFIPEAIKRGAIASVLERDGDYPLKTKILVRDTRVALSHLADKFYDFPSSKMGLIGITGTNGKTSITYMVKAILEEKGYKVGLLGTIAYFIGDKKINATHTTPESLDLQKILSQMLQNRISWVVMEASSHSLALNRVKDIDFDVAVFTNLTREHLDFHKTMESYREAKGILFENLSLRRDGEKENKWAILNRDDPNWEFFYNKAKVSKLTYSLEKGKGDVYANSFYYDFNGIGMELKTPSEQIEVKLNLLGKSNIYNALASAAVCSAIGIDLFTIKSGLASLRPIPGRMEKINCGQNFNIIIDYAHTPYAFERLLNDIKEISKGKIFLVFGCGGDRDKGKRPLMGKIASRLADFSFVTLDNPRTEDPQRIFEDILARVEDKSKVDVIPDRAKAIRKVLENAKKDDTVILAGKGHEDYQIIGDEKVHFSDKEEVLNFFRVFK